MRWLPTCEPRGRALSLQVDMLAGGGTRVQNPSHLTTYHPAQPTRSSRSQNTPSFYLLGGW